MISDLGSILGGLNKEDLMKNLNGIDPYQVMGGLGYDMKDTAKILKGDMGPVLDKTFFDQILCFETIMTAYGQSFNLNLLNYLFEKAKEGTPFTEEEVDAYENAINIFFNFVFKIGKDFVYQLDPESGDYSLIIKKGPDFFQMSIIDKIKAIIYLKDYEFKGNQ